MKLLFARTIAAVAIFAPAAFAQSLDSAVTAAVRAEMQATGAPGAAVVLVRDGRVAYSRGFGTTSAEGGQDVTPSTLFRIGSVTKALTGLAALQLRQAGRLSFDAPIGERASDLHPSLARLTLHHLLSHTAGMGDEASGTGSHDDSALAARVRRWGAERLLGPPDDVYSYSSSGYWLSGYVLERAGDALYADVVAKHVFEPLGMTRSTMRPLSAFTYPVALDHRVGPDRVARVLRPYPDDASTWPGGSAFSSAEELARLALALVDSGRLDGRQALPRAVVEAMQTPRAPQPAGSCSYTYGLAHCRRGDVVTLSHYGFRSGTGAVFTLIPSRRAAVIILSNKNGGIFGRTEQVALRHLVGLGGDDAEDGATRSARARVPRADRFAGTYASGSDSLHITVRQARPFYRYGTTEQPMRVVGDSVIAVVNANGEELQRFLLVRGRRSGGLYLHDGISAFRRIER